MNLLMTQFSLRLNNQLFVVSHFDIIVNGEVSNRGNAFSRSLTVIALVLFCRSHSVYICVNAVTMCLFHLFHHSHISVEYWNIFVPVCIFKDDRSRFYCDIWFKKTRLSAIMGLPGDEKLTRTLSHLDRSHECDKQMDICDRIHRACSMLCGKNSRSSFSDTHSPLSVLTQVKTKVFIAYNYVNFV